MGPICAGEFGALAGLRQRGRVAHEIRRERSPRQFRQVSMADGERHICRRTAASAVGVEEQRNKEEDDDADKKEDVDADMPARSKKEDVDDAGIPARSSETESGLYLRR